MLQRIGLGLEELAETGQHLHGPIYWAAKRQGMVLTVL